VTPILAAATRIEDAWIEAFGWRFATRLGTECLEYALEAEVYVAEAWS